MPVLGLMFNIFLSGLEKVVQANSGNAYSCSIVIQEPKLMLTLKRC